MNLLHNNILVEKLPIPEQTDGIITGTKPEQHYKVIACGPKATTLQPGYVIKPFPHTLGNQVNDNQYIFNTNQVDDIISK